MMEEPGATRSRETGNPPLVCRLRPRPASIEFRPWKETIAPGTRLLDWCLVRLAHLFRDRRHILVCDPVDASELAASPPPPGWDIVVSPHFRDLDAFLDASTRLGAGWMVASHMEAALCPPDIAAAIDAAVQQGPYGLVIASQVPTMALPVALNAAVARPLRDALEAGQAPGTFHELFAFAAAAGLQQVGGVGCAVARVTPGPAVAWLERPIAFDTHSDVDAVTRAAAAGDGPLAAWVAATNARIQESRATVRPPRARTPRGAPPRVLFVANASGMSGVESCTVELVRALSRRRLQTEALIAYEGRWTRLLREAGCVVHCRNERIDEDTPRAWRECVQTLVRQSPDVLHLVGNPGPIIARSAFAIGVPVVLHAHLPSARPYESAVGWVDRFAAVSQPVADALSAAGADPSLVSVIPNGIDTDRFAAVRDHRAPVRHQLAIPPDAFVMVAMARFSEEKGLDLLVDAVSLLRRRAGDVHLVIAGEAHSAGSTRAALLAQIERHGLQECVHLPGFVADVRPLLGAADLVVVPSTFEAFGMVALEALASGVLLLSTGVGGLQEVIGAIDDPTACAVRIGSRDPEELCSTVEMIRERRADVTAIADRGRRLVQERYGADAMAEQFEAIYEALLDSSADRRLQARG